MSWRWPATSRWSIRVSEVPLICGALECVRAGMIPGGLKANRDFAECMVEYAEGVPEELRTILFDPQTAGGLLISVAAAEADELVAQLRQLRARRAPHRRGFTGGQTADFSCVTQVHIC